MIHDEQFDDGGWDDLNERYGSSVPDPRIEAAYYREELEEEYVTRCAAGESIHEAFPTPVTPPVNQHDFF